MFCLLNLVQARSSYLPSEILWGHRFEQLVSYRKETGEYRVDYGKFNNTYEINTPLCSAKEYYEYQRFLNQHSNIPRTMNFLEIVSKKSNDETKTSLSECGVSGNGFSSANLTPDLSNRQNLEKNIVWYTFFFRTLLKLSK